MNDFIYLASQSPRRRALLEQIGVPYRLLLPDTPENFEDELPDESPVHYVRRVTEKKLDAAVDYFLRQNLPPAPILCADTAVVAKQNLLRKPHDMDEARAMLRRLSGNSHHVLTAVAVAHENRRESEISVSQVRFATLSPADIELLLGFHEWRDKAGGYAVQGRSAAWIENISGSYSGVVGLPLQITLKLLRRAGFRFAAEINPD